MDCADAFGKSVWPRATGGTSWLSFRSVSIARFDSKASLNSSGRLKLRAKPTDDSGAFLGGSGGVQFHNAEENVFVGEIGWPTVGVGYGAVEIVVNLLCWSVFAYDNLGHAEDAPLDKVQVPTENKAYVPPTPPAKAPPQPAVPPVAPPQK